MTLESDRGEELSELLMQLLGALGAGDQAAADLEWQRMRAWCRNDADLFTAFWCLGVGAAMMLKISIGLPDDTETGMVFLHVDGNTLTRVDPEAGDPVEVLAGRFFHACANHDQDMARALWLALPRTAEAVNGFARSILHLSRSCVVRLTAMRGNR